MIRMAMNQVTTVAIKPTITPTPIGRRCVAFDPISPAVIAASTSTHSSPSRKTSSAMLSIAVGALVSGKVGSGDPACVTPAQISAAVTSRAPVASPVMASGESKLRFLESAADIVIEGYTFFVATQGALSAGRWGNARESLLRLRATARTRAPALISYLATRILAWPNKCVKRE